MSFKAKISICHFAYFPVKYRIKLDQWSRLRRLSSGESSIEARLRLEWIIFYYTVGKRNALKTASHFNISRKTFHKWLKRFAEDKEHLKSLENYSRAPHRKRSWQVTGEEEANIFSLRKKHLKYGKKKLKKRYFEEYGQEITTWKIERVIRKWQLYPDRKAHLKRVKNRSRSQAKVHINEVKDYLKNQKTFSFLWHTDAIILYWYGRRRVIFTAIEDLTKIAYARVYPSNSSKAAKDFLLRLKCLAGEDYPIQVMHSDNGSEFAGLFAQACQELNIRQVYSRVRTPTDNACLERFNWTIQDEWLSLSEAGLEDVEKANDDLTDWLVEYNSVRPHQTLDYQTPLAYAQQHYFKVLPMWSASTITGQNNFFW